MKKVKTKKKILKQIKTKIIIITKIIKIKNIMGITHNKNQKRGNNNYGQDDDNNYKKNIIIKNKITIEKKINK